MGQEDIAAKLAVSRNVITGFAAFAAVKESILDHADVVLSHAEAAVLLALALVFS